MTTEATRLVTDTETKSVLCTPELLNELPGIDHAFANVDQVFESDPRTYLNRLEESQFVLNTKNGAEIACSLLMNEGQQSDELMVVFAPFADRNPKSSAETMYRYIDGDKSVSKTEAKPNTWNQITKSAVTADVLGAVGRSMPVLTVFAPVPTKAYSALEKKRFKDGDFTPAGRVVMEALPEVVEQTGLRVHGSRRFHKLHLSGASLGASNALGAAANLERHGFDVHSATAQELVLSPKSLPDLAKRFTVGGIVGEASTERFPDNAKFIGEAALRRAIDGSGSEFIGTQLRMVQGASKLTYMRGLTRPEPTIEAVEKLLDREVSVLVATADNSAMSDKTRELLPQGVSQVHIAAQEGAKLGHIVDEYVALSALVVALNVAKYRVF